LTEIFRKQSEQTAEAVEKLASHITIEAKKTRDEILCESQRHREELVSRTKETHDKILKLATDTRALAELIREQPDLFKEHFTQQANEVFHELAYHVTTEAQVTRQRIDETSAYKQLLESLWYPAMDERITRLSIHIVTHFSGYLAKTSSQTKMMRMTTQGDGIV
jgi:hypothetical protein